MNWKELFEYSPITEVLERIFYFLQFTSLTNLLFKTRGEIQSNIKEEGEEIVKTTKKRGRNIELFIIIYCVFVVVLFLIAKSTSFKVTFLNDLLLALSIYRINDVFTYAINMNIFDNIRMKAEKKLISGVTRTLVLSLLNYFELILYFGIIYSLNIDALKGVKNVFDAFYFSFATQLTMSCSEMYPLNNIARFVAISQSVIGFIFGVIIIARFVSLLPKFETVQKDG